MPQGPSYQQPPYNRGWPVGQQPAYGQPPGYRQPAYGRQPGYAQSPYYGAKAQPPRLELQLLKTHPYVQENVLLRVKVISSQNLKTATPQLPQTDDLAFQELKGPSVSTHKRNGAQEIVTSFVYQVTPLRAGRIEIPPIHVTGDQEEGSGYGRTTSEFDSISNQTLTLQVKPANPEVRPWLPLEPLSMKTRLSNNGVAVAGQPITLTIELDAVGASGNQLPSLERQLHSDAFRVYREKVRNSTRLDRKGRKIIGHRLESFTLVPQFGGDLQLPDLRLAWWNTRTGMAQHASVPVKPIQVRGGLRGDGLFGLSKSTSLFPGGSPAAFWIPVGVIFGVIAGYWLAVWIGNRRRDESLPPAFPGLARVLKKPFIQMAPAFTPLSQGLRATTACLNPVTRWQKLRRQFIALLPLSIRFWFCVRCVDEEQDPDAWGYTLRFLASKHMDLPPRAPFADIAERIIGFHPKADPQRIRL